MPHLKIIIVGINDLTGKLELSDHGRTEVRNNWNSRKITWKIKKTLSEVKSFRIVGKTTHNPFDTDIPEIFNTEVTLQVHKGHPAIDWEYVIHWKDRHGTEHISDPLIAIRSTVAFKKDLKEDSLITLIVISLGLLGVSWLYLQKKKSSK